MEKKKNAVLTDEIRRSVILFRLFGKKIPKEYHLDLIRSGEYDCKFFTKFIKKHVLSYECIVAFIDNYWLSANFMQAFETAINTYSYITYWVLELLKKDYSQPIPTPKLYQNPENSIYINDEVVDRIFEIEDSNVLITFFDYICKPVHFHLIVERAIETKNMKILKALSVDNDQIDDFGIEKVFKSGDKDLVEFITKTVDLPTWAICDLLSNKNYISIAKKYVERDFLDDYIVSKLIKDGHKQLLALYIKKFCLSTNMQYELADAGMYDLLKLHYKKYGPNRDVVNYVANLEVFKEKLGI